MTLLPTDPPALRRLGEFDVDAAAEAAARRRHPTGRHPVVRHHHSTGPIEVQHRRRPPRFGYQPGLDGLRALSVVAVILYHAGFSWMRGGWIGVEVFFVVSGFLITSLLLEERGRSGAVDLAAFWLRRARRLLPALFVMLAVVAVWALVAGSDGQLAQLRRDYPWALFYAGNWGQITGDVPYYTGDPPLLRHLWSLAIEEQFYLLWPLVFVAITRSRLRRAAAATVVGVGALASVGAMFLLFAAGPGPIGDLDRVNFLYLSTFTRAGGLLAGAAAAFVWRPWRTPPQRPAPRVLDPAGGVALGLLACIAGVTALTAGYVYQWLLPLVSLLALVTVMAVVHPAAVGMRSVLGWRPLVAVGRRSYGLYLWTWPIFVFAGATHGSVGRFVAAMGVAIVCSELCYRFVETPVRKGALTRWWRTAGPVRAKVLAGTATAVAVLVGCYAAVDPFDRAEGGEERGLRCARAVGADRGLGCSGGSARAPAPGRDRGGLAGSLARRQPARGDRSYLRGLRRLTRRLQRVRLGERAQLAGRIRQLVRDVFRVAGHVGGRRPRQRRRHRPRRARGVGRLRPRDGRR